MPQLLRTHNHRPFEAKSCPDSFGFTVPALTTTRRISQEDLNEPRREDLRHICVCSVDPPGCRDIDDALHARILPNGNWELGVHIADVTRFLEVLSRRLLFSEFVIVTRSQSRTTTAPLLHSQPLVKTWRDPLLL